MQKVINKDSYLDKNKKNKKDKSIIISAMPREIKHPFSFSKKKIEIRHRYLDYLSTA